MILHIATDEKWIDIAYNQFENVRPNHNKVIILTEKNSVDFVKKTPFKTLRQDQITKQVLNELFENVSAVVLHSIDILNFKMYIPNHIKVLWIGFGFDYYDFIYKDTNKLLLPKTSHLKKKLIKFDFLMKIKKLAAINWLIEKLKGREFKINYIKNIDYFVPVINDEYKLIKKNNSGYFPEFLDWNYGTLEDDLVRGFENKNINANNILIGNSATFTNNHIETFDLLSHCNIKGRKIICPLSYGNESYGHEITNIGKEVFGSDFQPLKEFMEIDDYIKTISSCSIVILNHIRQQAGGNIITMLYLGAKVFLREENPLYTYYINEGAKIFSISELIKDPNLINSNLSDDDKEQNRILLRKLYSRIVIKHKTEILIQKLLN
jgi:dTDP-N-acetylfucosamine:lipid II N-acetylfucosaminyltransferase